jgi:hypothetical protein
MQTNIVNDFLVFVIEEYKFLENKTAKETMELFTKYNVFDYITQNYAALHTMGGRAIADDINLLMERKDKVHEYRDV